MNEKEFILLKKQSSLCSSRRGQFYFGGFISRGLTARQSLLVFCGFHLIFLYRLILYGVWVAAEPSARMHAFSDLPGLWVFFILGLPRLVMMNLGSKPDFLRIPPRKALKSANRQSRCLYDDYPPIGHGGLLALSSLRTLSADAVRINHHFSSWRDGSRISSWFQLSGGSLAIRSSPCGLIFLLYPEGILVGGRSNAEPFLILFFSMLYFGQVPSGYLVLKSNAQFLYFSSAQLDCYCFYRVAIPLLGVIFLWIWGGNQRKLKPQLKILILTAIVVGLLEGLWFVAIGCSPLACSGDTLQTVIHSGQIQYQLEGLPRVVVLPLCADLWCFFQPILPAAIADPAP